MKKSNPKESFYAKSGPTSMSDSSWLIVKTFFGWVFRMNLVDKCENGFSVLDTAREKHTNTAHTILKTGFPD